jgi:hypothetical protein
MNIVPFHSDDMSGGLARCNGLLKDMGDALVLEIQVQDNVIGVLKSAVQEIRVPIGDVVSLDMKNGWLGSNFGVKLVLQTNRVELLDAIPSASQGRVELSIARKDVPAAEQFMKSFHDPASESK